MMDNMRRYLPFAVFVALLLFSDLSQANKYIRDGASGSTCADWGSNACDQMPTAVAGDTYYFADGTYSSFTVDAANVTVKKCSAADHGTETGYSAAYCDGQAVISGSIVLEDADGFTVDGSYRNESNWGDTNAYGFRSGGVYSSRLASGACADSVTIKYMNVGLTDGTTLASASDDQPLYLGGFGGGSLACEDWLLQYSYVHGFSHYTMIQCAGCERLTVEYTRFAHGWGKEAIRGQVTAKDCVIRYNQFYDACGSAPPDGCTAEIALWDGSANQFDGNKIYGNWFYQSNTNGHDMNSGGTIVVGGDNGVAWAGSPANNVLVYNNTMVGMHSDMSSGYILINGGTGNTCRNNLWYDTVNSSASCNTTSNNVDAVSSPFVSYPSNLHLSGATTAGYTLSSPYNTDMDGVTRGGDGTWDVGAYEYGTGSGGVGTIRNITIGPGVSVR